MPIKKGRQLHKNKVGNRNTLRGKPITHVHRIAANFPNLAVYEQCRAGQFGHIKPTGILFVYRTGSIEALMQPVLYIRKRSEDYVVHRISDEKELHKAKTLLAVFQFVTEYFSTTRLLNHDELNSRSLQI